ncbi:MAG: tyrosine-type recombinase/integrase [Bacteroidales bacterium]|nr:tyrosine-type recombinase/integrase [Bacteroidales bacterium]
MLNNFKKYLLLEKRYSSHTSIAYLKDIEQLYEYVKVNPDEIISDSNIIRNWIVYLMENNISKKTVNRKISALKTFYRYLIRQNLIEYSPLDKITSPKMPKRLPEFIPESDFDNFKNLFPDNFSGLRDQLIIEILYLTGIRRSELINLNNNSIDFSNKQIKVLGKRQKERIVPITDYLADQILKYNNFKKGLKSFDKMALILTDKGKPVYDSFIYRTVKKYLSKMTTIEKKSPHTLRHTFATHLLNNGADLNAIKELLGHSNLSATQIYTHNTFEKLNEIYKQAHPRA